MQRAVEILLENGANPNTYHQYIDLSCNMTALQLAFLQNDANGKIIDLLIEHGADVNRANSDGYTPLHFAIIGGHKKAIEMLIEKGSNVNAVENNFKMTPLLFVVIQDSWNEDDKLKYAELLINHGADVFAKAHHNNHEGTALDFAHSEKLRKLLGSKMGFERFGDECHCNISPSSLVD